MKESDLKRTVSEYLEIGTNQGKWYADRLNSGSVLVKRGNKTYRIELCREGTADFMVLYSGKPDNLEFANSSPCVIFLELKGEKGKTSPAQNAFKILVEEQGASYFVIRSVEELEQILA